MKKLFYILGIGLLMASCTEDFKDWADPMSNHEDPASTVVDVAPVATIDFATIADDDSVQIYVPTYNIEDGATVTNTVTLFNGNKSRTVNVDEQGHAKTTELRDALEALYGVPEEAINVPINVMTIIKNANGQAFRLFSDIEDVVKMAAGMYIVEGDNRTAMEFVEQGKYTLTVPAAEMRFFFLPFTNLNNFEEGKLGSDIEPDGFVLGGNLKQGADAYEIWLDYDSDYTQYIITVNTKDMTYDVEGLAYADMIWQAGNANGWGSPAAGLKNKGWKNARQNDGDYFGFMYLNGEFKFRSGKDNWNAPDWGIGASEGTLAVGAGNINTAEGFYMVEANIANLTYNLTPITTIGVIGSFPNTNWGSDEAKLTYNNATGAWEGRCTIPDGVKFKFRANDSWDINWGGDLNNLSYDGGDMSIAAGTYFIQLYITYEGDFHAKMSQVIN